LLLVLPTAHWQAHAANRTNKPDQSLQQELAIFNAQWQAQRQKIPSLL
jgi:hypothetical protein